MYGLHPKTFDEWLANHADRMTDLGTLARWAANHYALTYPMRTADHTDPDAMRTLAKALHSYSAYLRRWAFRWEHEHG